MELDAPALLPRADVRVVVIGADDPRAHGAAHVLRRGGYRNVAVLDGGIEACCAFGMGINEGMGTFEKAFGELVITELGTPKISIDELRTMQAEGREHALIDCRPRPEFEALRVPGARSAPGMTLLAGIEELGLDETTPIVVSCAGRTRSIIGAQTLRDAGIPNPVMSLENGAMGWRLADGELASGPETEPRLDAGVAARRRAADRASRLAGEHEIELIDEQTLASYRADLDRSTYLFDVRGPEEFATGHRAEFSSVAGGQLIQELTQRVAVHGARIVLVDEGGSEAILTAYWLAQMGFEASVPRTGAHRPVSRHRYPAEPPGRARAHRVGVVACGRARDGRRDGGCRTAPVVASTEMVTSPGATTACAPSWPRGLEQVDADRLLFTSEDGELARFAAADASRLGRTVAHLVGGNASWLEAGQELTIGLGALPGRAQ